MLLGGKKVSYYYYVKLDAKENSTFIKTSEDFSFGLL